MEFDKQVLREVQRIEECVAYFPKSDNMRMELAYMFRAMIGDKTINSLGRDWTPMERLDWLANILVRELGEWPKRGLAEVRGIYCQLFRPADGKEGHMTIERPASMERRLIVDDGQPRIGASPVDAEFETQINGLAQKIVHQPS